MNKKLMPIAIVLAGALVAGALLYIELGRGETLSSQEAGEKAINFINGHIEEGAVASLTGVTEEGNVYRIDLTIEQNGVAEDYISYISKDGKFLFSSGIDLEEWAAAEAEGVSPETTAVASAEFAQCLTDKGMKFYGSQNCSWCQQEKSLFGDALQYITYVECVDEQTGGWTQECQEAGIEAVPTWQLPDGEMSPGFRTLEQLAEVSGCPL
jgi:hypothetical protein